MFAPTHFIITNTVDEGCKCQTMSAKRSITARGISLRLTDCSVYTCKHIQPLTLAEYNIITALLSSPHRSNIYVVTASFDKKDAGRRRWTGTRSAEGIGTLHTQKERGTVRGNKTEAGKKRKKQRNGWGRQREREGGRVPGACISALNGENRVRSHRSLATNQS